MSILYGRSFYGERIYDKIPTYSGKIVNTVAVLAKE